MTERERFEAWIGASHCAKLPDNDNYYAREGVNEMWKAWQAARTVPDTHVLPEVKVRVSEYHRIFLQIGAQSFMLAYCPEDEPELSANEQTEWMAKQLKTALSNITPCVKMDIHSAMIEAASQGSGDK